MHGEIQSPSLQFENTLFQVVKTSTKYFSALSDPLLLLFSLNYAKKWPKDLENSPPRTANIAWSQAPEPAFSKDPAAEIFLLCSLYLNVYRIYLYLDGKQYALAETAP
ncbi:hypothetical protein NC653_039218 [Populus alba x Populus x berolinensis]|uniref:Uncharacterized protein n=1 Tax=Populus alba x Populus x berolinensis TaxID=444605 RepID=A0AAD6PQ95_9ROSI|nr:hypothetical protein NC653_039218 [Populus alba x Populus x berolinensis]